MTIYNSKDNKWGYKLSLETGTYHDKCAVDVYFGYNGKGTDVVFRLSYDNGKDDVRIEPYSRALDRGDEIDEIPLSLFLEGIKAAKEKLIDDGDD